MQINVQCPGHSLILPPEFFFRARQSQTYPDAHCLQDSKNLSKLACGFGCIQRQMWHERRSTSVFGAGGDPPARLNVEQVAWVLGCQAHDVPILVSSRLLKPLGNPSANGTKYFATADLLEIAKDRNWLVKMTTAINQHWQRKNARKQPNCEVVPHGSLSSAA